MKGGRGRPRTRRAGDIYSDVVGDAAREAQRPELISARNARRLDRRLGPDRKKNTTRPMTRDQRVRHNATMQRIEDEKHSRLSPTGDGNTDVD